MVQLFKFDEVIGQWIFHDFGVKSRVDEYTAQGYVVIFN